MLCVVWMAIRGGISTVIDKNGNLEYHDIKDWSCIDK